VLLLAICVAGVYFGCVVNMRGDKKRRYMPPKITRAAPPRQWQPEEQPSVAYTNLNASRASAAEYIPTYSPHVSSPSAAPLPSPHMQQPLVQSFPQQSSVQPYSQGVGIGAATYRQVQPEVVYQQGPATWHTVTTASAGDQNVAGAISTQSLLPVYHTSSV
uniref:Uncharacterized protein n=1 Tax=Parascaris univalens TaxID=6257 RepID=A0A915BZZ9_PARUN